VSLDVCLYGAKIGELLPSGDGEYQLAYTPETVERVAPGSVLLSHSLPVRAEPYDPDASRAYVEGLLPQGRRRRAIARELGLDPSDSYGLIAELGGNCLGAVSFGNPATLAETAAPDTLAWLDEHELEELLQARPPRLFDPANPRRMRFALPGERHKLALIHDEQEDRWAWPQPGLPSTHIVKPEPPERPGLAANEHACSLAYRGLGLPVAHTEIRTIAGQTCLVSKRFDRWGEGPEVERLHQETFAQALGIPPDAAKGRLSRGTPSLRESSELLRALGEEGAVRTLMRTTFCDLIVGCTELRAANAALLFGNDGAMLAPFYDIASGEIYGDVRPRPVVFGAPPAPLLVDLRYTIEFCGLDLQPGIVESVRVMGELCGALGEVGAQAREEGWSQRALDEAIQLAASRSLGFREEAEYLRPPGA
jgi:serine/threonine-protein kinase HipA